MKTEKSAMKLVKLAAAAMAVCTLASCAQRYSMYDATAGASNKAYVEFYSPEVVRKLEMGGRMGTSIYLLKPGADDKFLGRAGLPGQERLRVALVPGSYSFKCAPQMYHTRAAIVTVTAVPNQVTSVRVQSSRNAAAMYGLGVVGDLASAGCVASVEAPKPVDLSDHSWYQRKTN